MKSRERGGKHTLDESSVQTNFQTRARFAGFRLREPAPCHLHASTSSLHRQACRTAGFVTKSGDRPLSTQGETTERPCRRARFGVPASCCPSHVPIPPPETADRSRASRAALTTISQVLLLQQNETIYSRQVAVLEMNLESSVLRPGERWGTLGDKVSPICSPLGPSPSIHTRVAHALVHTCAKTRTHPPTQSCTPHPV